MRHETVKVGTTEWIHFYGKYKGKDGVYRGYTDVYVLPKDDMTLEYYVDLISNKRWGYSENILSPTEFNIHVHEMLTPYPDQQAVEEHDAWYEAFGGVNDKANRSATTNNRGDK